MKRTLFIITALLLCGIAFAQKGEIIYTDFEPDSILIYRHKLGPVWIDLDADGESDDLKMKMWGGWIYVRPRTLYGRFQHNVLHYRTRPDSLRSG